MSGENTEHRAFPTNTPFTNPEDRGMTLRDWFAGQWLIGTAVDSTVDWSDLTRPTIAEMAYKVADAMMEARKK
jgi:hypothetical protein